MAIAHHWYNPAVTVIHDTDTDEFRIEIDWGGCYQDSDDPHAELTPEELDAAIDRCTQYMDRLKSTGLLPTTLPMPVDAEIVKEALSFLSTVTND